MDARRSSSTTTVGVAEASITARTAAKTEIGFVKQQYIRDFKPASPLREDTCLSGIDSPGNPVKLRFQASGTIKQF